MSKNKNASLKTIEDFGNQWKRYSKNTGYYSSVELFKDYCGDLISTSEIKGKKILDVGSGTGRIVHMLLSIGASHVYAVEPSSAFEILVRNTQDNKDRITYFNVSGDKIPKINIDMALSFGVLHHIPDPKPVVDCVYKLLPPGGKFIVWLYGNEGNERYLALFKHIHKLTKIMPDFLLDLLSGFLNILMAVYIWLCNFIKLPMKDYVNLVFKKLDWHNRKMIIFDQLNPNYAKYYREDEAFQLLAASGFKNIRVFHRHNYSWTCIGRK